MKKRINFNTMKRLTTLLLAMGLTAAAMAVPAKRQITTLTKGDGTTVTAVLLGDEHFHYYEDINTGEHLFIDENGVCKVMTQKEFASHQLRAAKRASSANRHLARRKAPVCTSNLYETTDRTSFDLHGQRKALVILVSYSDKDILTDPADLNAQINEVGYSSNGHYGSVHDYFYDQSYGQFDLTFDVVGPVKLSKKQAYYGANDTYGNDKYPGTMVAEACELAYADGNGVNFADYDWDNDGMAEMVVCIYAGYGEAQNAPTNTVWPHQWTLTEAADYGDGPGVLELGGTYIDRYLVLNELKGSGNPNDAGYGKLDGIGTFCHEYSHGLGLMDFYHTQHGNAFGMNAWSIMNSGCYNADSAVPCAYTAYERMFCGWLDPTVLKEGCKVEDMKAITDEPEAYIIYNDAHPDEYYLLQNIQQKGFNSEAKGHGMLVIHVDYDQSSWADNVINNTAGHERCNIIPADNNFYASDAGLRGDPYPGSKNKKELTNSSLPAATLFNINELGMKFMNKPITEITESFEEDNSFGTISFVFNGGPLHDNISSTSIDHNTTIPPDTYDLTGRKVKTHNFKGIRIQNTKLHVN